MNTNLIRKVWFAPVALFAVAAYACGSSSTAPPGSSSGTPGADASSGGPGKDGSVPDLDAAPGAPCPTRTAATQAVHLIMAVTWPGSIGTNPGSGNVHVWTRAKLTFGAGNTITSVNTPCGSVVPDIQTTTIAGGKKVQPEFLPAVWESAALATFDGSGQQSSFDVNSKVSITAKPALVGLTMADPNGAWPAATAIQAVDSDGDGHPGITATPKNDTVYGLPPTSIVQTKHADQLYIASRTTTSLAGVRDTCDSQKGTATVAAFDSHVIGCRIEGGADCAAADIKFIDDNRTVFVVTGATYEAKIVPDGATCAAVRAAVPAN